MGLFLSACQSKPTKVYEAEPVQTLQPQEGRGPLSEAQGEAIIVDARSSFDFGLSHVPGSVNIHWEDFTQSAEAYRGVLEGDLFFHARRLARLGISPKSKVIVVGKGLNGFGEEGRVAWTLKYLGISDVHFANIDSFERTNSRRESAPRPVVGAWRPQLVENLLSTKAETEKVLGSLNQGSGESSQILDVRVDIRSEKSPKEFASLLIPHIVWTDFFNEKDEIKSDIEKRLVSLGLDKKRPIIVVSQRGIEAAGVVLALRQLGYNQASLLAGGVNELITKKLQH